MKNIFFDLDGTITDSMSGITRSVQYALKHVGIIVEDLNKLKSFVGPPLKEAFVKFYGLDDQTADKAKSIYREYYEKTGIFDISVYQGVPQLLNDLKENRKKLILATSKPTRFTMRILEHLSIGDYFDFVSGASMDETRVKKADIIEYAMKEMKIDDLSECVMIGDRFYDVEGAKKIGLKCIGVLYGYGSYEELKKSGADYIVKDPGELSDLLKKMN